MKHFTFYRATVGLIKSAALLLFLLPALGAKAQTAIAVQGGGTDVVNSVTSCWGFSVTQSSSGGTCLAAGSVAVLPNNGTNSIRVGGGCSTGCTSGSNCISSGFAATCGASSFNGDLTFNTINIAPYTGVQFQLFHRNHGCSGSGFDSGEFLNFKVSTDGAPFSIDDQLQGFSDYNWTYATTPAGNTGTIPNPYIYSPASTSKTFQFQINVVTNRIDELAYLDDMQLTFTGGKAVTASQTTVCAGQNVTFTAHADVTADANWDYQWLRNGSPIGGATSSTFVLTTVAGDNGAQYSVTYSPKASAANGGCTLPSVTSPAITLTVNANPAAPTVGATPNPICAGQNLTLTASNVASVGYAWTGPNTYSSASQNPTAFAVSGLSAGVYTVTVTDGNGCTSTATTATVVVNALPSAPAVGATPNPICVGQNLTLTASTIAGVSYSWNGPNTYSSASQNPTAFAVSAGSAGVYTVTVTDGNGCTATAMTSSVTVNTNPSAPAVGATPNPICVGNNLTLTASTVAGASYAWTGPSSYSSASQNPTAFAVNAGSAGVYTVTVTDGNGCTATAMTSSVTVNTNPSAPSVGASPNPICVGKNLTLTASTVAGVSYAWTGPSSYSSAAQNPAAFAVSAASAGVYTVTVTDGNGCTATATTSSVVVNTNPSAPTVGATPNPICVGNNLSLTASTVAGVTYAWMGPNTYSSALQNPTASAVSASSAGVYTVTVTDGNGCTATAATSTVTVNTNPSAPTVGASPNPLCVGKNLTLTASTLAGVSYAWTGPNTYSSALQNPTAFAVGASSGGVYTVTVTDGNGCTATAMTSTVVVNALPSALTVGATPNPLCVGKNLTLTASTVAGVTYAWTGPNTYSSASQNPSAFAVSVSSAGVYTVTVTDGNGCTASATTSTVVVNANPAAPNATASPNPLCATETLNLTSSTVAVGYGWTGPGTITNATSQNASVVGVTAGSSGVYTLTITNANGCTASASTASVTVFNLTAPTITTITAGTPATGTLNVSWSAVPGVSNYQLFYRVLGATTWASFPSQSTTTRSATYLQAQTTYEFTVEAHCPSNASIKASSVIATGTTANAPLASCIAPIRVYVEPGTGSGVFNWTAPANAVCSIVAYGPTAQSPTLWTHVTYTGTGALSQTISGLSTGTPYGIRVRTNCDLCQVTVGNRSAWSQIFNFTPARLSGESTLDELAKSAIQVYPNPNRGTFTVSRTTNGEAPTLIQIFDMTGRLIHHQTFTEENEAFIDISDKASGVYLLKVGANSAKVVVE